MVLTVDLIGESGDLLRTLQIEPSATLKELRADIEKEINIPKWSQKLFAKHESVETEISSIGRCGALGTEGTPIEIIVKQRDEHVAAVLQDLWENCAMDSTVPRWFREQADADRGSIEIVMEVLLRAGECLKHASDELKGTRVVVLQAVQKDGEALEFASPKMTKDPQVVMAAVCQNGMALQFASDELKASPSIVRAALTNDRRAKIHAKVDPSDISAVEPNLANDPDRVYQILGLMGHLCTISADPSTKLGELKKMIEKETSTPRWEQKLLYLGREVRSVAAFKDADKTMPLMLMLVNRSPDVAEKLKEIEEQSIGSAVAQWLNKQTEESQDNYDIVMECVLRSGEALQWASKELKRNKELAMAAVKTHGIALAWVSSDLQKDKEVVLAAVSEHGGALEFASADLKKDTEVVKAAVRQDSAAIQFASAEAKQDAEVQKVVNPNDGGGCARACAGCVIS